MSFEELIQEQIKALNENTKALVAYTRALNIEKKNIDVEHTQKSACNFCGVTTKTFQNFIEDGSIIPSRRRTGTREYFKENDLVILCETKKLYGGEYGELRNNPTSLYYAG